jgi:glycosidase
VQLEWGVDVGEERFYLKSAGLEPLRKSQGLPEGIDSFVDREWGYATSNYFAADFDLGFPKGHASPTASADLTALVAACHRHGVRFFADVVMAFATRYAYRYVNFLDFHVHRGTGDPEEDARDDFGGDLFKYNFWTDGYDPIAGETARLVPARRLMLTCLARWMLDFRIDGIRMDSVPNIMNWDFVQDYKDLARTIWRSRWAAQGLPADAADARFLVVVRTWRCRSISCASTVSTDSGTKSSSGCSAARS